MTILLLAAGLPRLIWAANDAYYNYLQGMVEERAGNTTKALESYEKAVQQDPQALQVYRDMAELRLRLGQPDAALVDAEHVKELAPKDPSTFIFLGNIRVAQGDLAKAADAYEQALKLDPSNLRALENLGNYYALLDPDKSLSYYQRYIDINPRDADIYFQMALVNQKRGNLKKALPLYQQSIELDSEQIASHMALADLYEQEKSTAAAIAEYETAIKLQPASPLVTGRLGNLLYRDGQWDRAKAAFETVAKATPQEPSAYYWLARVAEEKKDWKEAATNAEKAYKLSQDPQFLALTAYYMTLDHQVENAVKYLEKAKENDPNNANVLLFLGMNYLDMNKVEKAQEVLAKGVAQYPKDVQLRFQLGSAEDRLNHFDAAVDQFQTVLKLDPKNSAAMNYLGYSWADRGIRLPEAEKLLRQAVALDPDNGAYLDSLGWVRYKQGDASEARHFLEKAVILSPDPLIYDHLGDACLADKHPEAALQAWSKALSMDPKNDALRKKIQDQGEMFFKSPDAKKYVKYLEGNFKQAQTLTSDFTFEGRLHKRSIHTEGKLNYEQPDRISLDVPATDKAAETRFSLNGAERKVRPAGTNPALSQMAFDGLTTLSQFLSGRLTDQLNTTLDSVAGVQTQFSHPNASGGEDHIKVVSYDFVEGLWLPSEMRLSNDVTGWEAQIKFSSWTINEPPHHSAMQ
jgi:tetratricopeptide (TPR) repeat protein